MPIEPWWEINPATTPHKEIGMVSPELRATTPHKEIGMVSPELKYVESILADERKARRAAGFLAHTNLIVGSSALPLPVGG
jgi:hypothetical protein